MTPRRFTRRRRNPPVCACRRVEPALPRSREASGSWSPGHLTARWVYLRRHGQAIRYSYVPAEWPLDAYQTVFAREPGSADAERRTAVHAGTVADLVSRGILIAPVTLHGRLLAGGRRAHPRALRRARGGAALNAVHTWGARVLAVGTTVLRSNGGGRRRWPPGLDGPPGHSGVRRPRRRRPPDGLARAALLAPAAARGGCGARFGRALLPRGGETRLPASRVRRPAPDRRRAAGQRRRGSWGERALTTRTGDEPVMSDLRQDRAAPRRRRNGRSGRATGVAARRPSVPPPPVARSGVDDAAGERRGRRRRHGGRLSRSSSPPGVDVALSFRGPRSSVATTFTTAGPAGCAKTTRPIRAPAGTPPAAWWRASSSRARGDPAGQRCAEGELDPDGARCLAGRNRSPIAPTGAQASAHFARADAAGGDRLRRSRTPVSATRPDARGRTASRQVGVMSDSPHPVVGKHGRERRIARVVLHDVGVIRLRRLRHVGELSCPCRAVCRSRSRCRSRRRAAAAR